MFASKTFRTLTLVAALIAPMMAGVAHAEQGMVPPGATASGRWVQTDSRTMLADSPVTRGQAAQNFLELSGATGGDGQHS
jgi:hypothetical protein